MKGKNWDCEDGDEAIDAGALLGREDLPPFNRCVGDEHGEVERDHGTHDLVEILCSDHDFFFLVEKYLWNKSFESGGESDKGWPQG